MIGCVEKYNLQSLIKNHVEKLLGQLNNKKPGSSINKETKIHYDYSQPKLIGQENGNILLFSFIYEDGKNAKTFIVLLDLAFNESKIIFSQNRNVNIINATVNKEITLLAFTIFDKGNYKSFISEISPQNHIFSLNVERTTYQRVQFLYQQALVNCKVSHLLFINHKESIGLYHINLAIMGTRYVMCGQPHTQQIVRKFLWSQFDPHNQRLYYVTLYPKDEEGKRATAVLTVVEFKADGTDFDYLLNFPLPITFPRSLASESCIYRDFNVSPHVVSCKNINLIILTQSNGSFYVCYQHPSADDCHLNNSQSSSSSYSSSSSLQTGSETNSESLVPGIDVEDQGKTVCYTICSIHGVYKLQCSSFVRQTTNTNLLNLLFIPWKDFILVFLPNEFLHILDIGTEHEPANNILINDREFLPDIDSGAYLRAFNNDCLPSQANHLVLDANTFAVSQLQLNHKGLFNYFLLCNASTRISLIHIVIDHLQEKKLMRKMIQRISLDAANVETVDLLKEYLVIVSYMQMKQLVALPLDLKIFPFTTQELFRGQVERDQKGRRIVFLCYKHFDDNLNRQIQKCLSKNKGLFWKSLYSFLTYEMEHGNKRFPLKLLETINIENLASSKNEMKKSTSSSNVIVSRLRSFSSGSNLPANLDKREEKEKMITTNRNNLMLDKIISYVTKIFGKELKAKATNMCREYVLIRSKIILGLWRSILKSLDLQKEIEVITTEDITTPLNDEERNLFQMLERLKLILDEMCHPYFPGLNDYLAILAFRCLNNYQFFQYVDAGIVELTPEFVLRVLVEVSGTESPQWKFKLISSLPKEKARFVLQQWENCKANRILVGQYLTRVPSEPVNLSASLSDFADPSDDFVPLQTLLEAMQSANQSLDFGVKRGTVIEPNDAVKQVSQSALVFTKQLQRDIQMLNS